MMQLVTLCVCVCVCVRAAKQGGHLGGVLGRSCVVSDHNTGERGEREEGRGGGSGAAV